ncbi:MAG: hypothetical protein EBQ59_00400, partial [Verrucomicrobia bacterium]|nr:hypothetical protein [Verrucomicrobiota bacterium]
FNRDIRPILADSCFHCHGPDPAARKASLRLDTEAGFFAPRMTKDGKEEPPTIIKGDTAKSGLFQRITSQDEEEMMPPPKEHKKLKPEQVAVIKRWIEQGASWQPHWSLVAPQKAASLKLLIVIGPRIPSTVSSAQNSMRPNSRPPRTPKPSRSSVASPSTLPASRPPRNNSQNIFPRTVENFLKPKLPNSSTS